MGLYCSKQLETTFNKFGKKSLHIALNTAEPCTSTPSLILWTFTDKCLQVKQWVTSSPNVNLSVWVAATLYIYGLDSRQQTAIVTTWLNSFE